MHFSNIPSSWIQDPRLSFKALGILAAFVDHGGHVTQETLAAESRDGKNAIASGIRELVGAGYLQLRRDNGRMRGYVLVDPATGEEWRP